MRRLICALLGATLLPCPAFAGVLLPKEPGQKPLAVRKSMLRVQVTDQVARATIDEVFENLTDTPLEGRYLLPLPDGAAISGFATWVDGQRVESQIQEKGQAEKTYQAAQQAEAQPALLEQVDPHTFATRVDGIAAHGTKRVEAQLRADPALRRRNGNPAHPLERQGPERCRERRRPPGAGRSQRLEEDRRAHLLHAGLVAQRVGPSSFVVRLASKNVVPPDELVVRYRTESSRLGLSFATFKPEGEKEGYFLLLASPQELTTDADIVQKDVVFVFDTSGSMEEDHKIDQARTALKRCLGYLNKDDRFGIVAFSDSLNPFKTKLIPASPDNVTEALAFADGLAAAAAPTSPARCTRA